MALGVELISIREDEMEEVSFVPFLLEALCCCTRESYCDERAAIRREI